MKIKQPYQNQTTQTTMNNIININIINIKRVVLVDNRCSSWLIYVCVV